MFLKLMAASSVKQLQHEQRPSPQVKSSWLLERTEEMSRRAKSIISSWFQGQKIFNVGRTLVV